MEPTAALCFTVSYDAPPKLQEVLHHVVGQHGHLNWAVPLRVAPAAICNRVAINVPKRMLADLPSLVRRLRERLPDVDVQGADVADRPFAAERRQVLGGWQAGRIPSARTRAPKPARASHTLSNSCAWRATCS